MPLLSGFKKHMREKLFNSGNMRHFTPEKTEALFKEYQFQLGLDVSEMKDGEFLKAYVDNRQSIGYEAFSNLSNPLVPNQKLNLTSFLKLESKKESGDAAGSQSADDNSSTSDSNTQLKERINNAFDTSQGSSEKIKKSYKDFFSKWENTEHITSTREMLDELKVIGQAAIKMLAAQQKIERANMVKLLADDKAELTGILGIAAAPLSYNALSENMLAKLDETHSREIKALRETVTRHERQFHIAANKEFNEALFIAHMHRYYPKSMREQIDKKLYRDGDVALMSTNNGLLIKGVKLEDLDLETIRGRKITQHRDEKTGETTFEISLGDRWRSPLFYADPRYTVKAEMRSVIEAVKASGQPKITMTLEFKHEKVAMERAKQALEACLEAGYDLKDITIELSYKSKENETKTVGRVFKESKEDDKKDKTEPFSSLIGQARLQAALNRQKTYNAKLDQINPKVRDSNNAKKELQDQKTTPPSGGKEGNSNSPTN